MLRRGAWPPPPPHSLPLGERTDDWQLRDGGGGERIDSAPHACAAPAAEFHWLSDRAFYAGRSADDSRRTALSFLGVGLRPPVVSWGVALQQASNVRTVAQNWWLLIPALFVVLAVLCFNSVGDGLRDAADPYQ